MTQVYANGEFIYTRKSHNASAEKICVDRDSCNDEAEYEEKSVSVPGIHAAVQMVDELALFALVTLGDEALVTALNSTCRLLQDKRFQCLKQKSISNYFSQTKIL